MDKLDKLIEYLCAERGEPVPHVSDKRRFFRALVNVRMPRQTSEEFLRTQNEYLKERLESKGITDVADLTPVLPNVYLWQGDITTLKCDGIVNAANSSMLGCFCPNHDCIDNAIHTFAGVQLRRECAEMMKAQGHEEETGRAKITGAYNLPCKYVIHTVGPIVCGEVTEKQDRELESCYLSCLRLAAENRLESIAFCCISTGAFRFPAERAARIAVRTVLQNKGDLKVIFNVFNERDHKIYAELLTKQLSAFEK